MSGNDGNTLARCVSVDLEVGRQDGRIHAFAGVRPDLNRTRTFPARRVALASALAGLDSLVRLRGP